MSAFSQLKRSEKILIGLVGVTLLLAAQVLISRRFSAQRDELEQRATALRTSVDANRRAYAELQARVEIANRGGRTRELVAHYEQSNAHLSSIITELADQDREGSLRITRLATEDPTPAKQYIRTTLNLTVESTFPSLGKFLERLESTPLLEEVDSVEIQRTDHELKRCAAKVKLLSYVMRKAE